MSPLPKCPKCSSEFTYEDGEMYVCPECANVWGGGRFGTGAGRAESIREARG